MTITELKDSHDHPVKDIYLQGIATHKREKKVKWTDARRDTLSHWNAEAQ